MVEVLVRREFPEEHFNNPFAKPAEANAIHINEEMILIKITNQRAGETFNKIQHGIIDTVQAILGANAVGDKVTLEAKTAKSPCVMLDTLRATLVDAETVQVAMALATRVMPPPADMEG
jgi:hypothetical protein